VERPTPDGPRLAAALARVGGEGCYLYSLDPVDAAGAVAHTRFFNPTIGIVEDPATGTAAGPLVALFVASGKVPEGITAIVEQASRRDDFCVAWRSRGGSVRSETAGPVPKQAPDRA
jgi:trans-2,3-dihydro-3-hydroxyanthranilate isomerase